LICPLFLDEALKASYDVDRSLRWMTSTKATNLQQQENETNDEWLKLSCATVRFRIEKRKMKNQKREMKNREQKMINKKQKNKKLKIKN